MRPLPLHIEDRTYVKMLDYVSVDEVQDIPQWQQDEVARKLELIESGNMKARSWDEASKDIFKKLGLLNHA